MTTTTAGEVYRAVGDESVFKGPQLLPLKYTDFGGEIRIL